MKKVGGFLCIIALALGVVLTSAYIPMVFIWELQDTVDIMQEEIDSLHRENLAGRVTKQEMSDSITEVETLLDNYVLPRLERNSNFVNYYLGE